jgi:3-dehydroquinate synthetase
VITEVGGSGSLSATHAFTSGGIYTVTVKLTDDDTGQAVDARRRAGLAAEAAAAVREALRMLGPFPAPERDPDRLRPLLERDKKATARGIAGVLLERIGKARVEESVSAEEWLEAAAIMQLS